MTIDHDGQPFRLLTAHAIMWSLAMSLANGFVGAYLLRLGFSIAATLAMYALLLTIRFSLRSIMLPLVRRIGMRRALVLGASIAALQFLPLIRASEPAWLAVWVLIVSAGECLYWPICHAANAVCGGRGRRGRQLAVRQIASTAISVVGPVAGGMFLTNDGPAVEFGLATAFCLLSTVPLLWMPNLDLGAIPTARQSCKIADLVGLCAFAADGWMCAGTGLAWPMILFSTLGSSYGAFGWASSAAQLAGALAGLGCGFAIDRGYRACLLRGVAGALLLGIALRAASAWAPWEAFVANAVGAAAGGIYFPVLMSIVYDRAKRSGSAYHFHLSTEAAWDAGAVLGALATATVAWSGAPITLAVLPSALGIAVVYRCARIESGTTAALAADGLAQSGALGTPVGRPALAQAA